MFKEDGERPSMPTNNGKAEQHTRDESDAVGEGE